MTESLRGLERLRDPAWARRMNDAGEQWRSGLLKGEVAWLIDEVERLKGLLRQLEWTATDCGDALTEDGCPACERTRLHGHAPDCWLAAELT